MFEVKFQIVVIKTRQDFGCLGLVVGKPETRYNYVWIGDLATQRIVLTRKEYTVIDRFTASYIAQPPVLGLYLSNNRNPYLNLKELDKYLDQAAVEKDKGIFARMSRAAKLLGAEPVDDEFRKLCHDIVEYMKTDPECQRLLKECVLLARKRAVEKAKRHPTVSPDKFEYLANGHPCIGCTSRRPHV